MHAWHRLRLAWHRHTGCPSCGTLALTPLAPTRRLMGLGVLLGLTGSVLINVGNNVQALGTELL